ncbi:MAG: nucleoside deaminase [Lentisphaeria bacterium]|nr:nucleoside deaminase [Lentisphaeria bacterium]
MATEDLLFMRAALEQAELAFKAGEVPIGAVAVENGNVIAVGRNRVEECKSVSSHAEFEVIKQIEALRGDWRMQDITLYVTKEPCFMCSGMLINSRVKRIVFGVRDSKTGGCGGAVDLPSVPENLWHPEVEGGVLEEECLSLIQQFFRERRKKA